MTEKCRVLELLAGSLSDGGAETLVKDYVHYLDKDLFEPAVLVDYVLPRTANAVRLKEDKATIFSIYPRHSILWRFVDKFFREPFFKYRLKRILKQFRPDVVHVHLKALHYLDACDCLLDGVKLFYTCHSEVYRYLGKNNPEEQKAAEHMVHEKGMRLIGLRNDMVDTLNAIVGTDTSVLIRNCVDLDKFQNIGETKEDIRSSLDIRENSFVIGHVGRFIELKNHSFVVDVFAAVKERHPNSTL